MAKNGDIERTEFALPDDAPRAAGLGEGAAGSHLFATQIWMLAPRRKSRMWKRHCVRSP